MQKLKGIFLFFSVLLAAVGLWGVGIEPRLVEETRYRVGIPALPPAWEGREVAFFADLQIGMFLDNEGTVRRIVDRVLAERPAAVLIGGDFVYHPTETTRRSRQSRNSKRKTWRKCGRSSPASSICCGHWRRRCQSMPSSATTIMRCRRRKRLSCRGSPRRLPPNWRHHRAAQ